jgi:uncharacterized membrane protein
MNLTNMNRPLIFAALFPWATIAIGALITPRLTRPDLFFAVTVKPSFRTSETGNEILRGYKRFVMATALLALLPIGLIQYSPRLVLFSLLGPVVIELAGCFGAFLVARRRTLPHHVEPSTQREAELVPRHASLPGGMLAQAGPFALLVAAGFYLALNWQRIPERFPIHWGMDGKPNGWGSKNVLSVFAVLLIGAVICGLLGGIQYAVTHGVRRINSSGSAGQRETRFVRAISFFLLGMEYWLALMGLLSWLPLRTNLRTLPDMMWPIMIGETLIIATIFILAYRMGQGGWRLQTAGEKTNADAPPVGDRTPDECWKLGVFYFNSDDPALFVEKRFGVGWTLNFANAGSWWFLGGLLLFGAGSVIIAIFASR